MLLYEAVQSDHLHHSLLLHVHHAKVVVLRGGGHCGEFSKKEELRKELMEPKIKKQMINCSWLITQLMKRSLIFGLLVK